jgi:hypothetical protein
MKGTNTDNGTAIFFLKHGQVPNVVVKLTQGTRQKLPAVGTFFHKVIYDLYIMNIGFADHWFLSAPSDGGVLLILLRQSNR